MLGKDIFEEALRLYAGPHVVERVRKDKLAALERSCEPIDLILLSQDIKPFTSISAKLTNAHLNELFSEYLDRMVDCIKQHGGVVDHIHGNALLAYWESRDADPVISAVKRAGEIGDDISSNWAELLPGPIVPLHGVDADTVLRGNFGAKDRINFTVLGAAVNFTVRLCALNNSFQTRSLFSSRARALAGDPAELRLVESVALVGRAEKEELFTVDRSTSAASG